MGFISANKTLSPQPHNSRLVLHNSPRAQNIYFASFIIQSVHYKTISTTYVVEPKILHYCVQTDTINMSGRHF